MASEFPERRAALFRNGRNQAIRIPREFELPGKDVVVRKEGERLVIEPRSRLTPAEAIAILRAMPPLDDDDWPEIADDDLLPLDDIEL